MDSISSCSSFRTTTTIGIPEKFDTEMSVLEPRQEPFGHYFTKRRCPWRRGKKVEKQVCEKPCIRKVFRPLGFFAKCFGLFPAYDLSFVEKLNDVEVKWVHIADYIYAALVCFVITSGAISCIFNEPQILLQMRDGAEMTDYYVVMAIFYMTIIVGVWAIFVFPKSSGVLVRYLDHFAHVDKILEFDGRYARDEGHFARRVLCELILVMACTFMSWWMIFICDLETEPKWSDYIMVPVISIAVMTNLIPTAFFLFFLNSIHIRILQFNDKVRKIILPITPSCFACKSFMDYGKELDDKMIETKSEELAFDLEKLRILHGEVTDLVHETSCIFGPHLIRDFGFTMVAIIMYSYFIVFLRSDQGSFWPVYVALDLFGAFKITFMCLSADYVQNEASALLKILQKVSALRLSPECNTQIQMFMKKLDAPVAVTASGFFSVDRRLLTTIVGAVATYFVILIQFKLTDMSSEFKDLVDFKCNNTLPPTFTSKS